MAIIGREAELDVVRRFLTAGSGTRVLFLGGEAGIGKSTIWQQALAMAAESGFRVVSSRPTEAEARLPFAGLVDLFGDLLDEIQPELPPPQRLALDIALLRTTVAEQRPEPLAISLAVLALVREAAARGPLAIGVDDVPWLDQSSASVLEFVLRRLDTEPVAVIAGQRTGADGSSGMPPPIAAMPAERVTGLRLEPLSAAHTELLLAETLGLHLVPSTMRRLHRTSGGNPFYAVEIARALQRRGLTRVVGDLRLPDTLSGLVRDRLNALSDEASAVVVHASALSQPATRTIMAAVGEETGRAGLADAAAAGVLTEDAGLVRFSHPLLAAEAYAGLDEGRRRDLHRRLAAVVTEQEEHARHLAIGAEGAEGPDEEVAETLERAAERAHARGAPDAAADLAERAVPITPMGDAARHRRLVAAAQYRLLAGEPGRARDLLEAALAETPAGDSRAQILVRLGQVQSLMGAWVAAEEHWDQALREVGDDIALRIEIELALAGRSFITGRKWEAGAQHAADAMRLADELGDPAVIVGTIGHYASWLNITNQRVPSGLAERAAELEPWTGNLRALDHPDFDLSNIAWSDGDADTFREKHTSLLARAERLGDYSSLPFLLPNLVRADFADGRPDDAVDRLDPAERMAHATGQRTAMAHVLMWRTMLLARIGLGDEAWDAGRRTLELIAETGWRLGEPMVRNELAMLELSRRNPAGAFEILDGFDQPVGSTVWGWSVWVTPLLIEALIGLGRLRDAQHALAQFESGSEVRWVHASETETLRARALVAAAEGDSPQATELISGAADASRRRGDRWELARTQLVAGEIHRRARRRAMARAALTEALQLFEGLGAALWVVRAGEELERTGAGRDDDRGLTATQLQVAQLAASKLTNQEIADRLFMSVHTVEAHLSSIYRTLDIGSRRDLAAALRQVPDTIQDSDDPLRDSVPSTDPET